MLTGFLTQRTRSLVNGKKEPCGLCVKPFADFALKTNTGEHTMSFNAKSAKLGDAKNAKTLKPSGQDLCGLCVKPFANFALKTNAGERA